MVVTMSGNNLCPPAHFVIQYIGNLQTSDAYISKTYDLNDIKFGRLLRCYFQESFESLDL